MGEAGSAPGRGLRSAAPHVCEPGGWWEIWYERVSSRCSFCGLALAAVSSERPPLSCVQSERLLCRLARAFRLRVSARPGGTAPGLRRSTRRAGRVAGRGRSTRRPRFFRLRLHSSRSLVSAPCSPIQDPRSLIPDWCSRTPALRPDPGWSLGGAASLAPL